jgi:hypothetical protein
MVLSSSPVRLLLTAEQGALGVGSVAGFVEVVAQ